MGWPAVVVRYLIFKSFAAGGGVELRFPGRCAMKADDEITNKIKTPTILVTQNLFLMILSSYVLGLCPAVLYRTDSTHRAFDPF
jgi:hypothetical protein